MINTIEKYIYEAEIPVHLKGFHFLCKSVDLVIEDNTRIYNLQRDVYAFVAREYKTTSSRVERDIRTALEIGFKRHAKDSSFHYFYHHVKLTNKEYIARIAHLITK